MATIFIKEELCKYFNFRNSTGKSVHVREFRSLVGEVLLYERQVKVYLR